MKKRVAIIGAGPAGLVSAKSCIEYGLEPVVFEKTSVVGGVWADSLTGTAWRGMHTNLSKWSCMFSDYPWGNDIQEFPVQSEVASYLQSYADHFDITKNIRFQSEVSIVKRSEDVWIVESNGVFHEFDAVIVASGFFAEGVIPNIKNKSKFSGKIIHSSKARPDMISSDDHIVIAGGSFSGYELAAEFAKVSKHPVSHVFRRPAWVLNRMFPVGEGKMLPVDFASYSRSKDDSVTPLEQRIAKSIAFFKAAFGDPKLFHPDLAVTEDLSVPPYVVISDDYLNLVQQKRILPVRGLVRQYNQKSVFSAAAQSSLKADTVVWATGFRAGLPFLDADVKSKIHYDESDQFMPALLHDAVWPNDIDGLAFVGFYRGPYFGIMELQARWVAGVMSGNIPHPSQSELDDGVTNAHQLRLKSPRPQFPYGNYVEFADRIAKRVGCYPAHNDNDILHQWAHNGVFLPSQYRLEGYGANRNVVEQVYNSIPFVK